jgi:hypothetical protein
MLEGLAINLFDGKTGHEPMVFGQRVELGTGPLGLSAELSEERFMRGGKALDRKRRGPLFIVGEDIA